MGAHDSMTTALTVAYLLCFQLCAIPSIVRVVRRRSSTDLSVWREWLLLIGVACQFLVMWLTGADWRVQVSPLLSGVSVGVLLIIIYRFRSRADLATTLPSTAKIAKHTVFLSQ